MAVYNDKSVPDVKAVMGTYVVSTDIGADESGQGPAGVRTRIARAKTFARTRRAIGGPPAGVAMGLDLRSAGAGPAGNLRPGRGWAAA